LELGPAAVQMHEEVGAFVACQGVDQLVTCGALGRSLAEGAKRAGLDHACILEVPDAAAAAAAVKTMVKPGDIVLVKASRGMKLEQVVHALQGARRTATKAS
ncbi:MAG: glutamate ligase domain-containing protein, partial [Nitrospiraceae bacterium]